MSGDKLLGGPQAGIVVGRRDLVARMRKNPLVRALRPGKLTLAVLAATLDSYLDGRPTEHIPVPAMLTTSLETLDERSRALAKRLDKELGTGTARTIVVESRAGGGAAPGQPIESRGVAIATRSGPNDLAARLRFGDLPVIAVVRDDEVVFNLRTVAPEQDDALFRAIIKAVREP